MFSGRFVQVRARSRRLALQRARVEQNTKQVNEQQVAPRFQQRLLQRFSTLTSGSSVPPCFERQSTVEPRACPLLCPNQQTDRIPAIDVGAVYKRRASELSVLKYTYMRMRCQNWSRVASSPRGRPAVLEHVDCILLLSLPMRLVGVYLNCLLLSCMRRRRHGL